MSTIGKINAVVRGVRKTKPAYVDYRIPLGAALGLLILAVAADLLQALIDLLWFTGIFGIIAWGACTLLYLVTLAVLYALFAMLGYNALGGKRLGKKITSFLLSLGVESLPILSFLPSVSMWTWSNISVSREEDRERAIASDTIKSKAEVVARQRAARAAKTAAERNATIRSAVSRNVTSRASSIAVPTGRDRDVPRMHTLKAMDASAPSVVRRTASRPNNIERPDGGSVTPSIRRSYTSPREPARRVAQAA